MKKTPEPIRVIAILHDIRSLHNVGSIFRTADAAGIEKIYVCGITPSPLDRFGKFISQFEKVSLGAERSVQWEKRDETWRVIEKLKKEGYSIFAVEQAKNSVPYYELWTMHYAPKIVLVMGNEVKGLPKSILQRADKIIEIPMLGKKESLNVSVAFGIVAFAVREPVIFGKQ